MADEVRVGDEGQPEEAGEAIHLPGPSYQPVALAFGVALVVTGVVLFPPAVVIGVVIVLVTLFLWIRDTRREISELPLEH
jgi:Flp pilus assembly protein TadB